MTGQYRLDPARELLVWCTAVGVRPDAPERIAGLLQAHYRELNWGTFLDEAVRQRVAPLVWSNLRKDALPGAVEKFVPRGHEYSLWLTYGGNRIRNGVLTDALSQILRAAHDCGLDLLVRKGVYLSTVVYRDLGARSMSDIDLLVRRPDAGRGVELLTALGYTSGRTTRDMSRIEPYSRRENAITSLTIPNLPTMVRLELNPVVRAVEVDLTTGLFERGTGHDYPIEEVFAGARSTTLFDAPARVASPAHFLIDLGAHLYRHAKSITCIRRGTDLNLSRFCDVARYARRITELDGWAGVLSATAGAGIERPVYFALHWTDHVYPGCVPASVLDALRPDRDDFLYSFGEHEQRPGHWEGRDLFARMFDHSRQWA
jgi:Uncharacterised nucleotidyltransferase